MRSRALSIVLSLATIGATAALLGGATTAQAAPPKALIDSSTVVGSPSQEEQIATALGFAVTVVDDTTWGSLTAADFGQYDLLIAGDPSCGKLPPGLVASASVFGPVVLGLAGGRTLAGNRIVVGTDPVFHDFGDFTSPGAKGTIIREGVAFAGSQPGRTGLYFDSTCASAFGQASDILASLAAISAGTGTWTIDASPPCGGSVSLIASNPSFADLTTASLQGWNCSVHESFPTFPTDWSALAVATDTATTPTCGVDPGTGANACGEAYILIAGSSIVVNSRVISVSPLDATNPVGASHTVTANVHDASGSPPVAGQLVDFTVTGQNAAATGTCVPADCKSDANGDVSFTYADAAGAGDDTIKASFTDAAGSLQTATAQKHWVTPTGSTLTVSKAGTGAGTVTSSPAGIDCGATCSASFASGTIVTLTATPDAGSTFTGWSGDCTGTGPCTVTMDQDRAVTAMFDVVTQPQPRVLKQGAVASLRALLPTGDEQADRKIERAIEEIGDSLDPQLWVDDSHLTGKGKKVFHEEEEAARALRHIDNPPSAVASVSDALVEADEALARTAIDEATAAGGDPDKLAEAEKKMEKASEDIAKGHLGEAIEHYGAAWKKALQAAT